MAGRSGFPSHVRLRGFSQAVSNSTPVDHFSSCAQQKTADFARKTRMAQQRNANKIGRRIAEANCFRGVRVGVSRANVWHEDRPQLNSRRSIRQTVDPSCLAIPNSQGLERLRKSRGSAACGKPRKDCTRFHSCGNHARRKGFFWSTTLN